MRFAYLNYVKSGKLWKSMLALMFIFTAFTLFYYYSIGIVKAEHARAGLTFEPDNLLTHAFYVAVPYGRAPYAPMILAENLLLDFLIPFVLAFFYVDIEYQQRKAGLTNAVMIRGGKKITLSTFLALFSTAFSTLVLAFIYQIALGRILDLIVKPFGVVAEMGLGDLMQLVFASMKISIYFASLCVLAFCIGLYLKRLFILVYMLPMLINVSLILFYPRYVPSRLGFIDTFQAMPTPEYLKVFVIAIISISVLLLLPKLLERDIL